MEVFNMKYRLFLVIFLSSMLNILLGTFLQISNVSIGWIVLYSGLFEAGVFLLANKGVTVQIKEADIILVMKAGSIIEQGSHEKLLEANGFYADLYNSQFEELE